MEPAAQFTQKFVSENFDFKKVGTVLGFVLVVMLFWINISSPMVVTVTGSGQVIVPATNATLSFTLSANDNSISSAVTSVNSKSDTVRNYLKSKGVVETDIAQSQVTAVPAGLVTSGGSGFQATISMAFKTSHVTDVSNLISDLYANGATVVAQPVLSVENQDKLSQEAFDSALKDAKKQASTIGLKNWKFIKKIIAISQATSPSTSTATTKADALTEASSEVSGTNGVFKIVKNVSVSYKMW